MNRRLFNCTDANQVKWLGRIWLYLYKYCENDYRELDMNAFTELYNSSHPPKRVAAALIKAGAYDKRTTRQYAYQVMTGKQLPTSYNGKLVKYLSKRKALIAAGLPIFQS